MLANDVFCGLIGLFFAVSAVVLLEKIFEAFPRTANMTKALAGFITVFGGLLMMLVWPFDSLVYSGSWNAFLNVYFFGFTLLALLKAK